MEVKTVSKTLKSELALLVMLGYKFVVTHNDMIVAVCETYNKCFEWLQDHQSSSCDRAIKYEGYGFTTFDEARELDPQTVIKIGSYGLYGSVRSIKDLLRITDTWGCRGNTRLRSDKEHISGFIRGEQYEQDVTRSELNDIISKYS